MLSIIMPVYNDEKYLKRAIDSVISQTFSEWELIVVNDGSTDNTSSIIKSYNSPKIKIIEKRHTGVSDSRNVGLKEAKGEYIAFLDADDYLKNNMYEIFISNIKDSDICVSGYELQSELNSKILEIEKENKFIDFEFSHIYPKEGIYSGNKEVITGIRNLIKTDTLYPIWNKLYKKSIIDDNNIYFDENVISWGEDELFNYKYFEHVNKMACIRDRNIVFTTEKGNALNYSFDDIRFFTEKKIHKALINLFTNKGSYNDEIKRELAEIFICKMVLMVENIKKADFNKSFEEILYYFEEIFNDEEISDVFIYDDLNFQIINYLNSRFSVELFYMVISNKKNIEKTEKLKTSFLLNYLIAVNNLVNDKDEEFSYFYNRAKESGAPFEIKYMEDIL